MTHDACDDLLYVLYAYGALFKLEKRGDLKVETPAVFCAR